MRAAFERQSLSKIMLLTLIEYMSGLMSFLKWVFKTALVLMFLFQFVLYYSPNFLYAFSARPAVAERFHVKSYGELVDKIHQAEGKVKAPSLYEAEDLEFILANIYEPKKVDHWLLTDKDINHLFPTSNTQPIQK